MTEGMKDLLVCALSAKIILAKEDCDVVTDNCPSCGGEGTLWFRAAASNGHLRGGCSAEDCNVEFIE